MSDIVIGYHFLSADGTAYRGYRPAPVGEWEPDIPSPVLCKRGYHGSLRILDALGYAMGPILQRCEYRGVVYDDDKFVAVSRRALARADATSLLRIFAARCAESALALVANPDPRSLAACEVARRHALGMATNAELAAARAAAWAAASDAQSVWLESACLDLDWCEVPR